MSTSATHYPIVKEQSMVSLLNPFCIQLDSTKSSSLKGGLFLCLSMKKSSTIKVLWGVDIQTFQKELQLASTEIAERFVNNQMFEGSFKHAVDCGILNEDDGTREICFKCPCELSEEVLGEPPRTLYPVVVVSKLVDCDTLPDSTVIVVQFTVIHLKDSICSLDSHIVYQFVKTNRNKLLGLQPIFVSTSEPVTSTSGQSRSNNTNNSSDVNLSSQNNERSKVTADSEVHKRSETSREVQHCSSCGKIRKTVENIPSTRVHEVCDCTEDDLDYCEGERSDVKVTGQEDVLDDKNIEENEKINEDTNDNTASSERNSNHVQDTAPVAEELESCCVCQSSEIFYTLLPCRHACVCSNCIRLLDKCPICRSFIEAYFRLHNRLVEQELRESMENNAGPRLNRWQAFNQRLNEMLGFV
ncbi:cell growth regulator with RING finger domain protein 1-like isoform X2 [Ruditapes philippinarum]|nr:cell growth regulator with RING finger domain protein 1-like isoform X2 [Ruditapes philippinarum]